MPVRSKTIAQIVAPIVALVAGSGLRADPDTGRLAPASGRRAILVPVTIPTVTPISPDGGGFGTRDCPPLTVTQTDASFTGGQYIMEAGMGEGEIAAASYVIPAGDFPIKFGVGEIIFATSNATQNTVTQWSVLIWQGNPNSGSLVAVESSDDVILPHLRMSTGTNGVNIQFSVDPGDPDQIIINDNGSHTFSLGFRIDHHNAQIANPCFTAPPTCCNAFPVVDTSGLQNPARNWLFGLNCGSIGCPANGGWASFSALPSYCRPSGDWVIRASYIPLSCNQNPTVTMVDPAAATNTQTVRLTLTGTNFVVGATAASLTKPGSGTIVGSVVANPPAPLPPNSTTKLTADFNINGADPGNWTVNATTSSGTGSLPPPNYFVISAPQPPTVSTFAPPNVFNNAVLMSAQLFGNHFVNGGTTVSLIRGATTITATNVSVAQDTQSLTCDVDFRCAPVGVYDCRVTTIAGMDTKTNACTVAAANPPGIIVIDPTSATNCPGPQTISVFGNDFHSAAQVFLRDGVHADVQASAVHYSDSTFLTADFNFSTVATGFWMIRIVNPDCQAAVSTDTVQVTSCVPGVSGITPNSATNHNGGSNPNFPVVNITNLQGSNFVGGAGVKLTRTGQPDIVATNVQVVSSQQITCSINPYLRQVGQWNVVVTNPGGGQSSLPNGFTINAGPLPTITAVTPSNPSNCGIYNATIVGSPGNYLSGAAARLTLSGQSDIVGANVNVVSPTQMTVQFDLTGAATTPGTTKWSCVVTNPDGQSATRTNATNVTACATSCTKGDLNADTLRDGADINAFVRVFITNSGTATELCAVDMNSSGTIDGADLTAFVGCLLTSSCP